MQYHFNGFRAGDPRIAEPMDLSRAKGSDVDVLIIGCGPAGLTLATQLSIFPEIKTRIIERKSGPLEVGQADGLACRSLEMFEAFGFAEKVLSEAYWVNEVAFWRPSPETGALHRADRIEDVEPDLSEMPHVILNQARVHDFYLEKMANGPRRLVPDYDCELVDISYGDDGEFPLNVTLCAGGAAENIRARYVVGCDGARSKTRKIMGHELKGEAARQLWGVMDVLLVTDFPDIRLKAAIQSAENGSLLIIPREGGFMVRMYVELDALTGDERAADRNVTSEMLIEKAQAILAPFCVDVREVAWWSAYEIGQRVCDQFDDVSDDARDRRTPRIFIAGDACHTHSPKAGQGMNVSMADSFNLGWKLAAVLRGKASHELLHSYSHERRAKAKELIDFDRDMARLFSKKPETPQEAEQFQQYFKKHGRFTAGVETKYTPSSLIGSGEHQDLARGFCVGMRFHSAPVVRLADARPMQLGHGLKADGRWKLVAFAPKGDVGEKGGSVEQLCAFLARDLFGGTFRIAPTNGCEEAEVDVRAVFPIPHREMEWGVLPGILKPRKGRLGLVDAEKVYCSDYMPRADIFDLREVDRERGALVVLRPDQFVANLLPLQDFSGLENFLQTAIGLSK